MKFSHDVSNAIFRKIEDTIRNIVFKNVRNIVVLNLENVIEYGHDPNRNTFSIIGVWSTNRLVFRLAYNEILNELYTPEQLEAAVEKIYV